jgi:photosystem II stability/assembly factor-like uncharacterized protein
MKKLLLSLTLAGLLALALGGTTSAHENPSLFSPAWVALADQVIPTVSALDPASAANDIDTSVTITGTGFAATPTASLGSTPLKNVAWVNATTLTATVPWGIDPGSYPLTVTNPDGGTATLPNAFTVTQGIGQWNGGELDGGAVDKIAMKPGDPSTLYASSASIGIFRSKDGGENWSFIWNDVGGVDDDPVIDPHHPSWLYFYALDGLFRSQDEGDTWSKIMTNTWPDGRTPEYARVYVSPSDPQLLFVSSGHGPNQGTNGDAWGLIRSSDGGATWSIVPDLEGIGVMSVAFDPGDPEQMVLLTKDAQVFHSGDGGNTWAEVTKPPRVVGVGTSGVIAYNPYRSGEIWVATSAPPAQILKGTLESTGTTASWQDVTPANDSFGSPFITFTGADSVYIAQRHSADGGSSWSVFGPDWANGQIVFDPGNSQIAYVGTVLYGVEKTTDGGTTWAVKNNGLTGMGCNSMEVSRSDPQRVYATFNWPGVHSSSDGANNWTYQPINGASPMQQVREDPFNPNRLYAATNSGFYMSTNQGEDWSSLGWNVDPSLPGVDYWPYALALDPVHPGHLVVGFSSGYNSPTTTTTGVLYTSSDYGASWQGATLPQSIKAIHSIVFDPVTPEVVYLATDGTGVYKSTDSGAHWIRIGSETGMTAAGSIAIATHPQHMIVVGGCYRSTDGGANWTANLGLCGKELLSLIFVDGDSTRLYAGTRSGLLFSSDAGDTWSRAAGALGSLVISALGSATADGHSIIYAATNGGVAGTTDSGATSSTAAATSRISLTTASTIRSAATSGGTARATSSTAATPLTSLTTASGLVNAGIYRYVLLPPRTLAVVSAGGGTGTVSSSPAGISCGSTCSHAFAYGSSVSLSASPQAGSTFAGWSGACSGSGSCAVTMNADTAVTATFTTITHNLTVSKSGAGNGTVTSSPAGIDCGTTCVHGFNSGTSVTLTAAPAAGSRFGGWSGGSCSGTGSCLLTVNADTTFTAVFNLIPSPPQTTKKPPQTTITKAKINSGKRMATFGFRGSGGVKPYSFQCKLDKKKYSSCRSGKTYKSLKPGNHTFRVRAKDHAGRVDKTPAIKKFKIKH